MMRTLEENQAIVQEAAMERYLGSLEKDAKEAVKLQATFKQTVQGGFDDEKNERVRRKLAAEHNQQLVLQQIESNKARRAETRRDFIHAASSHSFPLFTETFIDEAEYERIRKEQRENWRAELDQQKLVNDMLRNIEERKHRDLAEKNRKENINTVARERGQEYDRLAKQGQDLLKSWERDVRLKTLKNAMDTGRDITKDLARR